MNKSVSLKTSFIILFIGLMMIVYWVSGDYYNCNTEYLLREKDNGKKTKCLLKMYEKDCKSLFKYYLKFYLGSNIPLTELDEKIIHCINHPEFYIEEQKFENKSIKIFKNIRDKNE